MPTYSRISARLQAIAVVQDTVAASKRSLSEVQTTTIINAVAQDLESGSANSVPHEVRLTASIASAVKAIQTIQDEVQNISKVN